ncbi:MAG: hydroxyacylglutathione hydrolase [Bacteriovoracaceae bacterium]|nr:hydroxyacylglutathione hydrolase [Bacteriovoracaceae bacterium]
MKIEQLFVGNSLRNFSYIIWSEASKEAICLDPFSSEMVCTRLGELGLVLKKIVNTHEHWDHIQGNEALKKETGASIYAHENAAGKFPVDQYLKAGDRLDLGDEEYLEVLDTPGHTFAHLCLLASTKNRACAVFTGDTLFNAGVGNCGNGGDPRVLCQTIFNKFKTLDDGILIYPGHEYFENNLNFTLHIESENLKARELLSKCESVDWDGEQKGFLVSTIGEERGVNTFFRTHLDSVSTSVQKISKRTTPFESDEELFVTLRSLRNNW